MEKTESVKNIAKALSVFHGKVGKVLKTATNPFFKSKYAALDSVLDVIQEPLKESGLVFSQFPDGEYRLTTILIHVESGEYFLSTYFMKPTRDDPQGLGSCITYQRRYALVAILGLNVDDDDDGNTASNKKEFITVDEAIKRLAKCNSVEDLKKLKKILTQEVIMDVNFSERANYRYIELTEK